MIPLAQWERLSELVAKKVGEPWRVDVRSYSPVAFDVRWFPVPTRSSPDWSIDLLRHLGLYLHLNRTAIIIGRKYPFLRKSFSYDAQGNIAPALILALLAALEAAPDLQEEICK